MIFGEFVKDNGNSWLMFINYFGRYKQSFLQPIGIKGIIFHNFDLPLGQVEFKLISYLREDRVSLPLRILLDAV